MQRAGLEQQGRGDGQQRRHAEQRRQRHRARRGSRTTINPGGQLNANSDGSGSAVDLNGALLVNNGTVAGTTNVYYGSLAQGSGTYGPVNVYNGGAVQARQQPRSGHDGTDDLELRRQYLIEINDATGTAGTNWNLWNINGPLALDAGTTPNSRFNLVLESESGGIPGPGGELRRHDRLPMADRRDQRRH